MGASSAVARGAVVIGVDRTGGGLPLLQAAADAEAVAGWLDAEGFEVSLLTDTVNGVRGVGRVSLVHLVEAVGSFCRRRTLRQLVVYFAGHGLHHLGSEIWLLSEAPDRADDAVNLLRNIDLARDCGIPNIVMISDACRLLPTSGRMARVEGTVIFPNNDHASASRGKVDRFLPTSPNGVAFEVGDPTSEGRRGGIFTKELLAAHGYPSGRPPDGGAIESTLVRVERTATGRRRVVDLTGLAAFLEREVPLAAAKHAVTWPQQPECIVETPPRDKSIGCALFPVPPRSGPTGRAAMDRRRGETPLAEGAGSRRPSLRSSLVTDIESSRDGILEADRRRPPWPDARIQVAGDQVAWAMAASDGELLTHDAGGASVEVGASTESVLIHLRSGNGVVVAAFAGYVASLKFVGGRLMNISYLPLGRQSEPGLDELRAEVGAKARRGVFRIATGEAAAFADRIRTQKGVDPTLGLYAAYAYQAAGRRREVASLLRHMRREMGGHAPFDMAMLARPPGPEAKARPTKDGSAYGLDLSGVFPFCPMLMQGWSYVRTHLRWMPPALEALIGHLVPSLWTTFDHEAMSMLRNDLERGALR